jgi:ubiquinol-cytochrome c reductase cytochrome c subunit
MRPAAALALAAVAATVLAAGAHGSAPAAGDAAAGRRLFTGSCASCHGFDARGIRGRGPSLRGVGAQAADFYLSTGRMPLDRPGDEPLRRHSAFTRGQIDSLVAYIAGFGGPPIPAVHAEQGDVALGRKAFAEHCAGCHQIMGEGGLVTDARVPRVKGIPPVQIAEAIRIGPYLMPPFSEKQLPQHEVDSIARYLQYAKNPDDRGGWSIGHIGPVPEGMVAWFIGALALVLVARMLGERNPE